MPINIGASLVTIQQLDIESTKNKAKKYFRETEPDGKVYFDPIDIEAQVNTDYIDKKIFTDMSDDIKVKGYLVVEQDELDMLGIELKSSDLIIKINDREVNFKIIATNPNSELPHMNNYATPILVTAAFIENKHKVGGVY